MLKLGTQTGSVMNHLFSREVGYEPAVGDGATILGWTDRYAATVISVENGIVTVQQDNAKRVDKNGFSEDQTYEYTPNPQGVTYSYRKGKDGQWQRVVFNTETGRWNKRDGAIRLGVREEYWDPTF